LAELQLPGHDPLGMYFGKHPLILFPSFGTAARVCIDRSV
jgi:hypothetical protein